MQNDSLTTSLRAELRRQARILDAYQAYIELQAKVQQNSSEASQQQIDKLSALLLHYKQENDVLRQQLSDIETRWLQIQTKLELLQRFDELEAKVGTLAEKLDEFAALAPSLDVAQAYISTLEQSQLDKEGEIRQLQSHLSTLQQQLATVYGSLGFRFIVKPIWTLRQLLFPEGSRRADLYYHARTGFRKHLRPPAETP